jgi:Protein of unknown function (DUF429)
MNIIGIDCATQQRNIGLALASFQDGNATVQDIKIGSEINPALKILKDWMVEKEPTLLALDSPLGWPAKLGPNLQSHKAGERIDVGSDDLFSRYTDREIFRRLKKKPFEVGADRIARTAHSALHLLDQLREETELPIPLAWNPGNVIQTCVIEVYPAATIKAMGIRKEQWLFEMDENVCLTMDIKIDKLRNEHGLDAAICVLAAVDFLNGKCVLPTNSELKIAEKEGWIWVRS